MDGYLALGVFITQNGAKLPDKVKQFILNNVVDIDDRFFDTAGWVQRKRYLDKFREKVTTYEGKSLEYETEGLFNTLSNHIKKLRYGDIN